MAKVITKEYKKHPVVLKMSYEEAGKVLSLIVYARAGTLTEVYTELAVAGVTKTHRADYRCGDGICLTPITNQIKP